MIAYFVIALALSSLGFFLLGRISFCRTTSPTSNPLPLSIIIPARNEEDNLPRLLESIRAQNLDQLEIIVVDDASTDATATRARQLHATVLPAPPLPAGWRGKTWACWHGAQAASHPTLLFLDADTWFESHGLAAIVESFTKQPTALSVLPFHVVCRPYEQLSAFFQLIMAAGSSAFTIPLLKPAGLFGQMLVIDRSLYFRIGGHESVKSEILENFHLAQHLHRQNISLRCLAGKHALSMRMYPHGMKDLVAGWTKAFAAGAAQTPLSILLLVIAWLSGLVMTAASLIQYPGLLSVTLYALVALQLFFLLRRLGTFAFYVALFYPIPLLAYFLLFARAITRRQVTWKGRTFNAAP